MMYGYPGNISLKKHGTKNSEEVQMSRLPRGTRILRILEDEYPIVFFGCKSLNLSQRKQKKICLEFKSQTWKSHLDKLGILMKHIDLENVISIHSASFRRLIRLDIWESPSFKM